MLVGVPSSIAFGVVIFAAASPSLVSSGAMAGMVGAAILGVVAPLVSRNRGFITAPCAPAAAVLSGVAADLASRSMRPDRIVAAIALTALFSALLQMAYGAARAGRLIKYIPYQVVNGYLSAVAVIIAVAQVPKFLGGAVMHPATWRWPAIVVGFVTIVAIALGPRLTKAVPATIIGLAAGVAAYFALGALRPELLALEHNPLIIGPIHAEGSLLQMVSSRFAALFTVSSADVMLVINASSWPIGQGPNDSPRSEFRSICMARS